MIFCVWENLFSDRQKIHITTDKCRRLLNQPPRKMAASATKHCVRSVVQKCVYLKRWWESINSFRIILFFVWENRRFCPTRRNHSISPPLLTRNHSMFNMHSVRFFVPYALILCSYRYKYVSEKKINTTERLGCIVYETTKYHRAML